MEIERAIIRFFPDEITKISQDFYKNVRLKSSALEGRLAEAIDAMGQASGAAQGLPLAVTTYSKLKTCQHTLYVLRDTESNNILVGILKVGKKRLFLMDARAVQHEVEPLCLLDFYVHESKQRLGCGKKLFEAMLKSENITSHQLAIDRPSPKCLSFLKKHYNLHPCRWQANSFVVYDGFFANLSGGGKKQQQQDKRITAPVTTDFQLLNSSQSSQQYHSHTGIVDKLQPSVMATQPSKHFNWSPQYVLNQVNHHNQPQHSSQSDFCTTNAPYLSMRQPSSQRLATFAPSQNGLNYSRYSTGNMYGSTIPRLPKPTFSSDASYMGQSSRYSRNFSSQRTYYK
ncbi:alpha-tubulin N-acetyltransferase 1-like [Dysidea avara]|uniref:alpha-tubulin N-acetyltransferase 1-like n=1 Tax=Dysidea avara TaxID=196820 RepID=UPI00331A97BC